MAKRTNRVAWGWVAVLALLLLIGVGALLYGGASSGVSVRVAAPGSLPIATQFAFYQDQGFCEVMRVYDLRFGLLLVSRRYFQPELPPEVAGQLGLKPDGRPLRTTLPAGPKASTKQRHGAVRVE
jgi:hypothetical protein